MRLTLQKLCAVAFGWVFLFAAPAFTQTASNSDPSGFPMSVWSLHKKVTQIPWHASVSKAHLRSDFRQEVSIGVMIRPEDLAKSGDTHDLILFARVLEGAKAITSIHSEKPKALPSLPGVPLDQGAYWTMIAIVRSGKFKLELALLDQATGRVSARYEDVSIPGDENDPLERTLVSVPKFEFVERVEQPKPGDLTGTIMPASLAKIRLPSDLTRPILAAHMRQIDSGVSVDPAPLFIIDKPGKLQLSVITIVSPPEIALGDPYYLSSFHENLTSFLSAFRRIDVVRGSAKLTAVDLTNRTLVLDRRDMKDVTPEMIDSAINNDVNTVSIGALKGAEDRARFFQDVLRSHFEAAQKESDGAEHVIIVVAARSDFPKGSSLLPPSSAQDCRCRVIYLRFALLVNETDDIDDVLKPYKPRVFDPLDWQEFRKDFGTIYQQLIYGK